MESLFSTAKNAAYLKKGKFGIEKESLRVKSDGKLSLTPHPAAVGNKSTNPYLTTDYSESQLEFITPPFATVEKTIHFLEQTHLWAYKNLGDELLWPMSMPCILPAEKDIPIAQYGNSEEEQEKEIYRKGLALRYGKKMQLICGIHYNFSLDDSLLETISQKFLGAPLSRGKKDILYFSLARNFLRYRWLLVYLFGASPVVDDSYEPEVLKKLDQLGGKCPYLGEAIYYKQYATSLRMSKFGYSNTHQQKFQYSYNSLSEYISDIKKGLNTPILEYQKMGIFNEKGEKTQLNTNLLQRENEYYAPIRFKAEISGNTRQIDALEKDGIQHIEIRILDIDPLSPTGISREEMHFTHLFLLMCLWEENSPIGDDEYENISYNERMVALRGRQKNLELQKKDATPILMKDWSEEIFAKLSIIAQIIDESEDKNEAGKNEKYQKILQLQKKKIYDTSLIPSQKIVNNICTKSKKTLITSILNQAEKNKNDILDMTPDTHIQKILNSSLIK